ncbi:MAG: S8 family serine peptidase, partial [Crocinitomicaceae bacterium]|nr:S8 family serine peptidase [Crocinitomicaceae bacterium]
MKSLTLLIALFFFGAYARSQQIIEPIEKVIVKFNWRFLDLERIDDPELLWAPASHFFNQAGNEFLKSNNIELFDGLYLKKSFPFLKTTDTISISRLGDRIKIPTFWSVFSAVPPNGMSSAELSDKLDLLYPFVIYAHPNYPMVLFDTPDDEFYNQQNSLESSFLANSFIEVDSVWNIETGKRHIKVGVYDSGIDTSHPDLSVLTGKSYYDLPSGVGEDWWLDDDGYFGHGTKIAGIIAATRNNGIGIAGIAGGNGEDTSGVSLISFKILEAPGSDVEATAAGIVDGARSVGGYWDWSDLTAFEFKPQNFPGYGLHIANHSYAFFAEQIKDVDGPDSLQGDFIYSPYVDCELCIDAYLFSLENNVAHVAARGNFLDVPSADIEDARGEDRMWPQAYPDHMVISVGASGYDGQRWGQSNRSVGDGTAGSMVGRNI